MNIGKEIELIPRTLRHAFATYHAESGLSLPILAKMLGHVSVRTTALYWQDIYQEPDNDLGSILAGKKWLERPKPSQSQEPPKPPITENFPQVPKSPTPPFTVNQPVIPNKNPAVEDNSLSVPKKVKKTLQISVSGISPARKEKFSLKNIGKRKKQINEQLPLITNQGKKPGAREEILLQKIKHLERQNQHLKALVQQFQARQSLVGDQKNETNAQII